MATSGSLDFGYPWWLSYGHIVILLPALGALLIGKLRHWSVPVMALLGLIAGWAAVSLLVLRAFGINGEATLPTQNFLRSDSGKVIDLGAGTGRSSIMVLKSRPHVQLVATDLFADSYDDHFGKHGSPQERLMANLRAAGVDNRATIETADMRKLPFANASFDGAVSAYAIDHLGREGAKQALAEVNRVLKPGSEFLMMLVANDGWTKTAFGPLLAHGGVRGADWWRQRAAEAGFQVREQGTAPATLYFVLARP